MADTKAVENRTDNLSTTGEIHEWSLLCSWAVSRTSYLDWLDYMQCKSPRTVWVALHLVAYYPEEFSTWKTLVRIGVRS